MAESKMTDDKIYLESDLDKLFPKGNKKRGEALVLVASANYYIKQAKSDTLKAVLDLIDNYCYCKNCRFAYQATKCECVCHSGWINKEELKKELQDGKS